VASPLGPLPEPFPPKMEIASSPSSPVLYFRNKGLIAQGYEMGQGFLVQAGSQAFMDNSPSITEPIATLRATLLQQGILVREGDCLKLTQDYTFKSSSTAASTLAGGSRSGPENWKDAQGRNLRELQLPSANNEIVEGPTESDNPNSQADILRQR